MEKNVEDIIKEIKQVDNNVGGILVPMLKDTITDYRKIVFKLIAVIIILIISITGITVYSHIVISKQQDKFNTFSKEMLNKYNDFLSQFKFESEEITQSSTATDGDSVVNDGIKINK